MAVLLDSGTWVRVYGADVRAGEVARRAGVNAATLRYYERRGLLPAPARTPSGHRHYDEDAVRFLRAIKEAQAIGFTLAEIEEYLRVARSGPASAELRTRAAAKIDEIDARIARLRRMRDELARIVGCACDSLDHCTCGAAYLARRGREAPVRPSPLHVTNGDSAGNTLRQTALGGAVLPWQDVLHEGPLPAGPRRELLQARAAFLSACGWGSKRSILASLEDRDRQLVRALQDGQQVVLWFEHDLYDQLQLVDALALAAPHAPELVVVGSFPGKPAFRGLGELTADELETLWPARVPASQDTLADGGLGLGCPAPARPVRARRGRPGGPPRAAIPAARAAPAARGAARPGRRPVRHRTAGAAGHRGGCGHAGGGLPGRARPGDRAVPRRRLVLPRAGRPGRRPGPAGRDAGRRPAAAAPAAGRPPCLRPAAAPAHRCRASGSWTAVMTGSRCSAWTAGLGGTHLTQAAAWRWDPVARLLVRPA